MSHDERQDDSAPFQFSLRALLSAITAAAVIAAAVAAGLGRFVMLPLGLLLAALNCLGLLAPIQSGRPRSLMLSSAWLLFLLSMVLPAAKGCQGGHVMGWEAASVSAQIVLDVNILPKNGGDQQLARWCFHALLTLSNILMVASPFVLMWRGRRDRGWYAAACAVSAVPVWCAAVLEGGKDLLAGYYVWSLSFLLLACANRIGLKTLLAMVAVALAWLVLL